MGGGGALLGAAVVLILVIAIWVLCHMLPFFYLMMRLDLLRVDDAEERMGLDVSHHGGAAYEATGADLLSANLAAKAASTKTGELEMMSSRCCSSLTKVSRLAAYVLLACFSCGELPCLVSSPSIHSFFGMGFGISRKKNMVVMGMQDIVSGEPVQGVQELQRFADALGADCLLYTSDAADE